MATQQQREYSRRFEIEARGKPLPNGGWSAALKVPTRTGAIMIGVEIPREVLDASCAAIARLVTACTHAAQHQQLAALMGGTGGAVVDERVAGMRRMRGMGGGRVHGWDVVGDYDVVGYDVVGDAMADVGRVFQGVLGAAGPLLGLIPGVGPAIAAGASALGGAAGGGAAGAAGGGPLGAIGTALGGLLGGATGGARPGAQPVQTGVSFTTGAPVAAGVAAPVTTGPGPQAAPAGYVRPPGVMTAAEYQAAGSPALSTVAVPVQLPQLAASQLTGATGARELASAEVLGQALNTLLSSDALRAQLLPEVADTISWALRSLETEAGAALGSERAREALRLARQRTASNVARGLELSRLLARG